jgi:UPF0148 protein
MDEEETIRRITRLLEMGGTMLATHHRCGAPQFRYEGKIVCPVCSFEETGEYMPSGPTERDVRSSKLPISEDDQAISMAIGDVVTEKSAEEGAKKGEMLKEFEKGKPLKRASLVNEVGNAPTSEAIALGSLRDVKEINHDHEIVNEINDEHEIFLVESALRRSILYKLRELSDKLKDEQDLSRLRSQLECIDGALKVLELLKNY